MKTVDQKVLGIIPARYGSSRFPGKPLAKILGTSLIQRTYENAKKCSEIDQLVVATDDERIFRHVKEFGGHAVMTAESCLTGTDRLADALRNNPALNAYSCIVNIQGDEPCLPLSTIYSVIKLLKTNSDADMATAVVKMESAQEAANPSSVKCVFDNNQNALYFSRSLIPYTHQKQGTQEPTFYKHLGIYAYKKEFLLTYAQLAPTPLQLAEDLEQLKALEYGYKIKVAVVDHASIGVDHIEDIKKVELLLCKQNTFSSQAESVPL